MDSPGSLKKYIYIFLHKKFSQPPERTDFLIEEKISYTCQKKILILVPKKQIFQTEKISCNYLKKQ